MRWMPPPDGISYIPQAVCELVWGLTMGLGAGVRAISGGPATSAGDGARGPRRSDVLPSPVPFGPSRGPSRPGRADRAGDADEGDGAPDVAGRGGQAELAPDVLRAARRERALHPPLDRAEGVRGAPAPLVEDVGPRGRPGRHAVEHGLARRAARRAGSFGCGGAARRRPCRRSGRRRRSSRGRATGSRGATRASGRPGRRRRPSPHRGGTPLRQRSPRAPRRRARARGRGRRRRPSRRPRGPRSRRGPDPPPPRCAPRPAWSSPRSPRARAAPGRGPGRTPPARRRGGASRRPRSGRWCRRRPWSSAPSPRASGSLSEARFSPLRSSSAGRALHRPRPAPGGDLPGQLAAAAIRAGVAGPLLVGVARVEPLHVLGQPLVRRADARRQRAAREVAVLVVHRLDPRAVDREEPAAEQVEPAAQNHELAEHRADGGPVLAPEVGRWSRGRASDAGRARSPRGRAASRPPACGSSAPGRGGRGW